MMRSPRFFAVACRAPNGEIVVKSEAIEKTWIGRQNWLKLPFLRGTFALLDAMTLGIRSMKFASDVQLAPEYQADAEAREIATKSQGKIQEASVIGAMVFGIGFGLLLFVYLPNLVAEYVQGGKSKPGAQTQGTTTNLIAGLLKAVFFIGYLALIGQVENIKEVFRYHGAEHKAINAMEHEKGLGTQECLAESRLHPRCGTSFAIIVLILSLVVFTFVPRYPITGKPGAPLFDITVRVGLEIMILPVIAGIAYELLRLAGKFRNQSIVSFFFKPGIWSQYLTTREPEAKHVEVAVAALEAVLAEEKKAG